MVRYADMYAEFDEDTDIHKVKKIFFGTEF